MEVLEMNSFISWIGGKKALRKIILEQFPESGSFDRYIEVFGGAAWVLFGLEKPVELEVYNDVNGELVNLFRCVKYHPAAVQDELSWLLMSREQFFRVRNKDTKYMTDIQRAARFFILIKESFGSDCNSFRVNSRDISGSINYLMEVSKRLNKTVIENLDFEHLIHTYDRNKAFFYLDPPYYDAEKYYPDRFNPEDHLRLKAALDNIKGRFVLSYNDCPTIRDLYKDYEIISISRHDNLTAKIQSRRYDEIIIKNY